MSKLKEHVNDYANSLLKSGRTDIIVGKEGSPVTSMSEDITIGEIGEAKVRIAKQLIKILAQCE